MTNHSQIDALLKKADRALLKFKIVDNGTVADGYDSAIAAFGPTVVLSGLMPALAFYCAETKNGKPKTEKSKIVDAISFILQSKYGWPDHKKLFNYCLNNPSRIERLTIDIVDASVALKMMVRTYKIKKDNEQ